MATNTNDFELTTVPASFVNGWSTIANALDGSTFAKLTKIERSVALNLERAGFVKFEKGTVRRLK